MMKNMKNLSVGNIKIGEKHPLAVICGPCVIEEEDFTLRFAENLQKIFHGFSFSFIFKASFDKANRSSVQSYRGPGLEKGMRFFQRVKKELGCPILTDIHTPEQASAAAEICDILQIPAFLCRQTDLLLAAGKTGKVINIKKGQFVAPWDMEHVVAKITSTKNNQILLTDRGTCFGYNNLVSDFRSLPIMRKFGYPVCFDATHSVQLPGGSVSQGQQEFIFPLARAAVAVGIQALFIEAHPDPKSALSDKNSVLDVKYLPVLLQEIEKIHNALNHDTQKSDLFL